MNLKHWLKSRVFLMALSVFLVASVLPAQQLSTGSITLTTTAVGIGGGNVIAVVLQADPDNTTDILVGTQSSQVIQLAKGDSLSIMNVSLGEIYAKAVSGTPVLNWLARNQ